MPEPPFGFGPGGRSGDDQGGSGGAGGPLGPMGDPQQFADALRQFADLMSWQGGPVNWDLAKNIARQTVAQKGDASVLEIGRTKVTGALALADEVVSSTDVGLPLGPEGTAALLPAGVAAFGAGLSVDLDEVRLFLALREAAHHRLFGHVPWLRSRLLGAVEDYARGIKVDANALREAMPQIDPANPEALNEALAGAALFQPEDTEQQKAALARL